jgi:integrase
MFNLAIDWGYAKDNPVRRVKLFSEDNLNLKERILTDDEEERLLEASKSHLRPIILTALHTGMRRGEILGLKWHQVDLAKRIIRVEKTKSGKNRFIPISEFLMLELVKLKKENGTSQFVFLNPRTRKPMTDVKTSFNAATRRAGIYGLRFHDLRHTFASRLVEMGFDLITVKDLLGHNSVITTQRYTHANAEQKKKAVHALG